MKLLTFSFVWQSALSGCINFIPISNFKQSLLKTQKTSLFCIFHTIASIVYFSCNQSCHRIIFIVSEHLHENGGLVSIKTKLGQDPVSSSYFLHKYQYKIYCSKGGILWLIFGKKKLNFEFQSYQDLQLKFAGQRILKNLLTFAPRF